MATFIQLCEIVREETGIAGTITSVVGNTGMIARLVNYVNKANLKIQSRKGNWNFLWAEWPLTTVALTAEYAAPSNFGNFDEESFWLNTGTTDAKKLEYVEYKEWRDFYRNTYLDNDVVEKVTIKPDNKVRLIPAPLLGGDTVTADYWKAPVALVNNGDISVIPELYHRTIVTQAKMYVAEFQHDTGLFSSSYVEHEEVYKLLKAHSLPGNKDDIKSESSSDMLIEVE